MPCVQQPPQAVDGEGEEAEDDQDFQVEAAEEFLHLRDGQEQTFTLTPRYDSELERYRVGVTIAQGYEKMSASAVLPSAWSLCKQASVAIVDALGKLPPARG